jgi:ACS family glucarate transporter-like MFS transporter
VNIAPHRAGAGAAHRVPVRFRILAVLLILSFVNYLLRNNMSVALPAIRAEFGYSSAELGWILGSFNITYALFQIPGGVFGEALGPRRALALIALTWGLLTAFTGVVPGLLLASGAGALTAFMVVRALMGLANAPLFPASAAAFASWFPVGTWALPNALQSTGLTLGQAAVGPLVTWLIVAFGWRESFLILAPLGVVMAVWWWWYGRDRPAEHRAVGAAELALITANRREGSARRAPSTPWYSVLVSRDVLFISASYFCMNHVFFIFNQWLFTYLVEERGFSLIESGFLYALPFVFGAVMAAAGGYVGDLLCMRIGARWGCRLPAVAGLVLVAGLLPAGAMAADPYVAVGLLALCFGCTQFTEGVYWSGVIFAAPEHPGPAAGVLNGLGNVAGFLAPLVGWMVDALGWLPTLGSGSAFAVAGALLWMFVRLEPVAAGGVRQGASS